MLTEPLYPTNPHYISPCPLPYPPNPLKPAHIFFFLPNIPLLQGHTFLHLHHWYWPVPLAHMCVFHTDVSMLAQAIFLAVHIHGVVCFGVEPLFYETERRARHPSDFEWVLIEQQAGEEDLVAGGRSLVLCLSHSLMVVG